MPSKGRLCVSVMHEDPVVDAGLRALLRGQIDIDLLEPATAGTATVVDVLVTDYRSALGLLARDRGEQGPAPRILIVTQLEREWQVRCALDAGAHGYLLMGCGSGEVMEGVRALGRGSRYLCQAAMHCLADSLTREALTGRETDVLQLLAQGLCNKSIGRRLGIAVGTVKAHVKGILDKLDASTRTQAVIVAAQRGLITREAGNLGEVEAAPPILRSRATLLPAEAGA